MNTSNENIIDLIKTLLFEISDPESKILYKGLIEDHQDYDLIKNYPRKSKCIPLRIIINNATRNSFYPVRDIQEQIDRGFIDWMDALIQDYYNIKNKNR